MALHSELPLYRACYDLLGVVSDVIRNMRRDIKTALGARILDSCIALDLHLRQANIDQDKEPELARLLERLGHSNSARATCRPASAARSIERKRKSGRTGLPRIRPR